MTTATNDLPANDPHHDLVRDIHRYAPADCNACHPTWIKVGPYFACLSHTCPDCGATVHALTNDRAELIHDCCPGCIAPDAKSGPNHFATTRCQSGRRAHCSCDTCF